ncbi:Uma2 family endonuclease [Anatilimnocola floriformis]|uniref:Uma2 family endonuclease n=1 Tax=Anatilimnocola floriformis TaxID=2948575 RepID=UPI0020C408C1|nr:Uma2 family endonuclease [Anatilimnocola floriformis]
MSTIPTLPTSSGTERVPLTLVDLANRFGEIPPARICMDPPPGEATEADLLHYSDHDNRLFELVDGTLIEKTMGTFEALVALTIATALNNYLKTNRLGVALGSDGQLKIKPDLIRVPDVCFISRERLKASDFLKVAIASVSPNLAIEVISRSNSKREMSEKLNEYFETGTEEVWYVYPEKKELHQYTAIDQCQVMQENEAVTSSRLLPGFSLLIASIFVDPLADEPTASSGPQG